VRFSIDLRHPDQAVLDDTAQRITDIAARIAAERRCGVQTIALSAVAPTHFPKELVDIVRDAARVEALPSMDMPSGAGHDAMYLNRICPSAMVFVPCLKGISHNEAESATAADLAAGVRVLARTLASLANR
jgi:N-carbamoyl-L-amino-acid hydrolase